MITIDTLSTSLLETSLPGCFIRPACSTDEAMVVELLRQNVLWLHSKGIAQWPEDWLIREIPSIAYNIAQGWVYVAVSAKNGTDSLVGTVTVRESMEEIWGKMAEPSLFFQKLARQRDPVYVGIGAAIIHWLEKEVLRRKLRWLRFDCLNTNIILHHYYEARQFQQYNTVVYQDIVLRLYQKAVLPVEAYMSTDVSPILASFRSSSHSQ